MLADVLLPAALAFIMFSVGLSLEAADFRHVFARPAVLAAALAGQLVLMPLAAFAVARLAGLPGELAVGLMILAACPGGASSAFLTRLARGNIALSLTVTVISSLAAIATFPLLLKLVFSHAASGAFADGIQRLGALPMERLVGSVLAITTLPTALGVAVRHRAGRGGGWRAERIVGQVALVFFAAIVLGTFLAHRQAIVSSLPEVGPAAMLLNLLAMAGGYALVALAGGHRRDSVAAAMECGLQNVGLAIFVAVSLLRQPLMAAPGIVYALVMNAGAFALILLSRKHPGR
ncbi:bile acid:sodium symporter family protein [Thauera linaloolentis]|uniref:Sodium symporter n=1 Tax=Thauera linaloolentis (strain DSM 12138 / JCM 21573 / CCUG 41526 / CIP 105981 / IAM 15112 / NBRC 102519 / 47Lol) TaxID=1123367 RepID=N6YDN4_THAL4|nr:bile acid:sodium symporter family protein [Thauera linaloolentis]ENO89655.1 sodium symporter [Thauera linaloolentis 47Lol = DSM 12138]MCM8567135.1 bile acid:sodium symporter family protein [Thauera linaloolentis]